MPITQAKTEVVNLDKDTTINGIRVGKGNNSISTNTAIGVNVLAVNTTGSRNVAVGANALDNNTTGANNTAVGANALDSNTTGYQNTVLGSNSLINNTTGFANIAIGANTAQANTTGFQNIAIGNLALNFNVSGANNIGIGTSAGAANAVEFGNIAIGAYALQQNTTGSENVAIGQNSAYAVNGFGNTAIGTYALAADTSSVDENTAVGGFALGANESGSSNTAVGLNALGNLINFTNCSGLGYNAQVTGSNQVQLGSGATTCFTNGAVQNRSDARDKADVRNTELGLEFINALRPVDFKWDMREDYKPEMPARVSKPQDLAEDATDEDRVKYDAELAAYNTYKAELKQYQENCKLANITHDGSKKRNRYHHGLIAQEVKDLLQSKGIDFGGFQDHKVNGGDDVLSIGYMELIAPLIKSVQELSAEIKELKSK